MEAGAPPGAGPKAPRQRTYVRPRGRTRRPCRAGGPCGTGLPTGPASTSVPESRDITSPSSEDTVDEIMTWSVTIDIGEHDGHTKALAHLHTRDTRRLDRKSVV